MENGHTCGWTCPCCVSCLSKQSGDVKNDDVTGGSMSTPLNVEKTRLSQRKCKSSNGNIINDVMGFASGEQFYEELS